MSAAKNNTQLQFTTWVFVAAAAQFLLLFLNNFPFEIALKDSITSVVLVAFIAQVLYLIQTRIHAEKPVNYVNFGIIIGFTGLYQLSLNGVLRFWLTEKQWTHYVLPFEGARACLMFFILTAISLYWWIQKNDEHQRKINQRVLEQERALKKAELDSIHQQLQPHFLFNSLNSIASLTQIEPKEAHRMIQLLSDFLRSTLRKDVQTLVSVAEEMDQVKLYLEIEKVRFGHRLNTEISEDATCQELLIPALVIQPLIENAIKFGLYGSLDSITIRIQLHCRDKHLIISVSNPYDSDFVEERKGKGFGITSIQRRLTLFYGQANLLESVKTANTYTTTLRIPQL